MSDVNDEASVDQWDDNDDEEFDDDADDVDADDVDGAAASESGPPGNGHESQDDGAPGRRSRTRRSRGGGSVDSTPFEPDERASEALDFVLGVVREMDMDCRVRLRRPRDGDASDEINIEITGRDAGRIIGKKGQVLQALQFLTHRVINRPGLDRRHVLVDAEGYRSRRDDSLASMARRLGKQAVEEGKIITFEPMNPRDRRVVHLALAKFEGVITKSDGEGDSRRVQIIPVRRGA
jgi:spoIIIJ-associated protein